MSPHRPYTAVLCRSSQTKVVEMSASIDWNQARSEFSDAHPGWSVVAVFAGNHQGHGRAFDYGLSSRNGKGCDRYIDPFDTDLSYNSKMK